MVEILVENYTPTELEDSLGMTLDDVIFGLEDYVESNYDKILDLLKSDLYING